MEKADKRLLAQFQCEQVRAAEESFARLLSEQGDARLFFVNEDQAFTDGQNIVVDPALRGMFCDVPALRRAEELLCLPPTASADRMAALGRVTRAQTIHESLHLLYTNFPCDCLADPRGATKPRKLALSLISNIIEDAFIEAAGCSVHDNMERYLLWMRVMDCCSNVPSQGTVSRAFSQDQPTDDPPPRQPLIEYLDHMGLLLLYPMVTPDPPAPDIEPYVRSTRELYEKGSLCGVADERYTYTQRIFDLIEPLIGDELAPPEALARLDAMLGGRKTHSPSASSIQTRARKGKSVEVARRLFTDENGEPVKHDELADQFAQDEQSNSKLWELVREAHDRQETTVTIYGSAYDCAAVNKRISIVVSRPRVNPALKRAYQNICRQYSLSISSHVSRFSTLLRGAADERLERQLFGRGVVSRRLGDPKRRYWYRVDRGTDVPELGILLMIDGSGSMAGQRRDSAITAAVSLHEVLRRCGVAHAVVEHRAIFGQSSLEHNILLDFSARDEEKYNLLAIRAAEGTREGLSLYWAEQYILTRCACENRLIVMISDGMPFHISDDGADYVPPLSVMDTANAARRIAAHGVRLVAIALDDAQEESCYEQLRTIYPNTVQCKELSRLTGQLLRVISRELTR